MVGKIKLLLLFPSIVAAGLLSVSAGGNGQNYDPFFDFAEVNPPAEGFLSEIYIWIPRYAYNVGDRITLYCEYFASPKRMAQAGAKLELLDLPSLPFEWCHRVYRCTGAARRDRGKLLVRRAPFHRKIKVLIKNWQDYKKMLVLPKEACFPPPERIPRHWLHGNPVKFKDCIYDAIWKVYFASADLRPGESFVRAVPNLLDYWYLKKGADGRMYVLCAVPAPDTFWRIKTVWLPLEGRYRVQHFESNVIEFEIRQ